MDETFGVMFRQARKAAGKTLADVAEFLGITVSYVSDVERAQRSPWAQEKLISVAQYLGVDQRSLIAAAAKSRGSIELDATHVTERHLRFAAALTRRWAQLSDQELDELEKQLEKEKPA